MPDHTTPAPWTAICEVDDAQLDDAVAVLDPFVGVIEEYGASCSVAPATEADGGFVGLVAVFEVDEPSVVGVVVKIDEETGEPQVTIARRAPLDGAAPKDLADLLGELGPAIAAGDVHLEAVEFEAGPEPRRRVDPEPWRRPVLGPGDYAVRTRHV